MSYNEIVFNREFRIYKKIKIEKLSMLYSIKELNDGNLILGGYYSGILKKKNWTFSVVYNDNIPQKKTSYLTQTETDIDYSQFNLTSSNKLICKKYFKQYTLISYEDTDDVVNIEKGICIFDYKPKTSKQDKFNT